MKFFYQAGAMGYGDGYWWHKIFNFPKLPLVTKTLTLKPKKGHKWAVLPIGKSVFNRVALDNIGICKWCEQYMKINKDVIVSIAGTDDEIQLMVEWLESILGNIKMDDRSWRGFLIDGVELNFSCPNVKSYKNKIIPKTELPLYLKLNHRQSPYTYDLDKIEGIRLNSIPLRFCGGSGKIAQKKNWKFIERYKGLNVAGCSFTSFDDIKKLEDLGCEEIGIGSIILTNPALVEEIESYKLRKISPG